METRVGEREPLPSFKRRQCIVREEESFAENFIHGLRGKERLHENCAELDGYADIPLCEFFKYDYMVWDEWTGMGHIISYVQENWARS
jgi:hypothetical protein